MGEMPGYCTYTSECGNMDGEILFQKAGYKKKGKCLSECRIDILLYMELFRVHARAFLMTEKNRT